MREQMKIIEEVNKPAWAVHRDQRREVNRERYGNSRPLGHSLSYDYSPAHFSGLSSENDKMRRDYSRKQV